MADALDRAGTQIFDEDILFIERFLAGDIEAFDVLYQKHYPRVLALATGILLNPDESIDATQEIFTVVYRKLHEFDRKSRFTTWLYRVAVNRSIQHARSRARHRHQLPLSDALEHPAQPMPSSDPAVRIAMERLALDDRAALTLFYWDELSLNEMAESLGCTPNAAKTRLFRARERFRSAYEEVSA